MEYPMPENMGFARRSIMDMLPEEMIEADRAAIRAVWEGMNKDQRRRLNDRIAMWRARLVLAETELEEAQKHDD